MRQCVNYCVAKCSWQVKGRAEDMHLCRVSAVCSHFSRRNTSFCLCKLARWCNSSTDIRSEAQIKQYFFRRRITQAYAKWNVAGICWTHRKLIQLHFYTVLFALRCLKSSLSQTQLQNQGVTTGQNSCALKSIIPDALWSAIQCFWQTCLSQSD